MWATKDELSFIRGLGFHRDSHGHPIKPLSLQERVALLERYRAALPLRCEWGQIDRREVELGVSAEISSLKRQIDQNNPKH